MLQVAVDANASKDANAARSLKMPRMLTLPHRLLIMLQVVKACKNAKKPGNRCLTSTFSPLVAREIKSDRIAMHERRFKNKEFS